jgi:hypothetical protein
VTDDLELWQQTLAAEHAAIWGFGLVGAATPADLPADAALDVHRRRRTRCADEVVGLGGDPVASAPAYDVPAPQNGRAGRLLATDLENACAVAYAALAGADERASRLQGAQWLRESAVAVWFWGGSVPLLPGLSDPTRP